MDRGTAAGLHGVLCVLLLYCCYPSAAGAGEEAYSEVGFPDPGNKYAACGVKNHSYICDPSNSLTESDLNRLNILIRSLRNVESCLCDKDGPCHKIHSHIIKVALVPWIKYASGGFPTTSLTEIQAVWSFAQHLRDKEWKLHTDTGCSMAAFIVLDLHTKRIWTATNYFGKKVITDDRAEEVGLGAKDKYFKQDMIYLGLDYMITKYKQFLEDGIPGLAWWKILLIVLGSLGGTALLIGFCYYCMHGGGGGGGGGIWGGGGGGGGGGCGGGGGGGGGCGGGGGG